MIELAMINSSWTIEKIREEHKIKYDSEPPVTAYSFEILDFSNSRRCEIDVESGPSERNTDRREYAARMLVVMATSSSSMRRVFIPLIVARAFVGCEAFVDTPLEKGSNITVIGAISGSGPECFVVKTGTTNQTVFRAFLERLKIAHRARPLRMVMDDAAFHKTQYVREAS